MKKKQNLDYDILSHEVHVSFTLVVEDLHKSFMFNFIICHSGLLVNIWDLNNSK